MTVSIHDSKVCVLELVIVLCKNYEQHCSFRSIGTDLTYYNLHYIVVYKIVQMVSIDFPVSMVVSKLDTDAVQERTFSGCRCSSTGMFSVSSALWSADCAIDVNSRSQSQCYIFVKNGQLGCNAVCLGSEVCSTVMFRDIVQLLLCGTSRRQLDAVGSASLYHDVSFCLGIL